MVYDNNESDDYKPDSKEVFINWYLNSYNHLKDSNISNFVVTRGYIYQDSDILNGVSVSVVDINDSLNLEISRSDNSIGFVVVHIIDTNASHLWYSRFNEEYNISKGSSCKSHFCFAITWDNNDTNVSGVKSGNVKGTKAKIIKEKVRAVKIFR